MLRIAAFRPPLLALCALLGCTAALAIACAPLPAAAQGEASKPNVLVILTDDQGYADVGVYGSRHIETPHLDRLAREGVMLTQFYAGAPLCSPSRAALLTGRTPEWAGVNNNTGIVAGLDRRNRQLALERPGDRGGGHLGGAPRRLETARQPCGHVV